MDKKQEEKLEEIVQDLKTSEKIACATIGPIIGLLPPKIQIGIGEKITRNGYQAATYMSLSSRIFNAVWIGYGAVSGACRIFGMDIDPTPMDFATWASLPVVLDSAAREFFNGCRYAFAGGKGFTDYNIPWGEPVISIAYSLFFDSEAEEANSKISRDIPAK